MKINLKNIRCRSLQVFILLIIGVLLVGCASSGATPQRIDVSNKLSSCIIYATHSECTLSDGNTYYADIMTINAITKWSPETWKENVIYCPKNLTNITNATQQCDYKKMCMVKNKWTEC
jgi:hypothetical protein